MDRNGITIRLAGVALHIATDHTYAPMIPYQTDETPQAEVSAAGDVMKKRRLFAENTADNLIEYTLLAEYTGGTLLSFDRCVFHGVSFMWRDKAWILTAPSGTGKTTQYVLWNALYGEEIRIMNGDKPILEWQHDGTVRVHPSPWRGKEGFSSMDSAPLGGVILLEQGQENTIRRLTPREALRPLFRQFMFYPRDERNVTAVLALEDRLLRSVPVWLLTNLGDSASAEMTHDTICAYLEQHE